MKPIHTAPTGEVASADSLANKILIEEIAAQYAQSFPQIMAQSMKSMKEMITGSGPNDEAEEVAQKLFSKIGEEINKIPNIEKILHEGVVEALMPYRHDTELLTVYKYSTAPAVAAKMTEISMAVASAIAPFSIEIGQRVAQQAIEEMDLAN